MIIERDMLVKEEVKRNQQINFLKISAILLIIIYHTQYLFGGSIVDVKFVTDIINSMGNIGVTLFFIMSGYGIYKYIDNHQDQKYIDFIKGRFKKIAKPYYFCLIVSLVAMGSAFFLQKQYIFDLVTHFTFTHNLFVSTHGSINGCLWTMGTIVQFYLIVPFLYKLIKKNPTAILVLSIVISLLIRFVIYKIIYAKQLDGAYYFVYGRQLITAIESFVIGMFISLKEKDINIKYVLNLLLIILTLGLVYGVSYYSNNYSNQSHMIAFTLYYTVSSIILGLFVMFFSKGKITNLKLFKRYADLHKHEYNIYLWHFLIIANMLNTGFITAIRSYSNTLCAFALLMVAVLFGAYINVCTNSTKK